MNAEFLKQAAEIRYYHIDNIPEKILNDPYFYNTYVVENSNSILNSYAYNFELLKAKKLSKKLENYDNYECGVFFYIDARNIGYCIVKYIVLTYSTTHNIILKKSLANDMDFKKVLTIVKNS